MQKLHQTFEIIMKKYTTEPAKVHLNSVIETIRNHLIMKNIGQKLKKLKGKPQVQFYILLFMFE